MKKIFLIRHGESEANANPDLYLEKDRFDHLFVLSDKGQGQAEACGHSLKGLTNYSVFLSPYIRAQNTWELIKKSIKASPIETQTDVRIREQEFKDFKTREEANEKKARAKARGKLFYRYKHAESGSDVINRVGSFYNQLRMDMVLGNHPDNVVIVCHEITIKAFLVVTGAMPLEDFDKFEVHNCEVIELKAESNLKFRL